jgi:hypothetical protein
MDTDKDPLAPARGCLLGLLMGATVWSLLVILVLVLRRT